jgi:hypothetical protein
MPIPAFDAGLVVVSLPRAQGIRSQPDEQQRRDEREQNDRENERRRERRNSVGTQRRAGHRCQVGTEHAADCRRPDDQRQVAAVQRSRRQVDGGVARLHARRRATAEEQEARKEKWNRSGHGGRHDH